MSSIPLIDMSLPDDEVAVAIHRACKLHGFFSIENHGIASEFMESVFKETQSLFALPFEEKMRIKADKNNRGWTPLGEETLDPAHQSEGDTKEGFYFGREIAHDSEEASKPLHGPNQWPNPDLLPLLRLTYEKYIQSVTALGFRLLKLLAMSLGLPADFFLAYFRYPMLMLRPLHYTARVSQPTKGVFGAGAHSDYGMLTILATDGTPGLQIYQNGKWINVDPVPDTFIINLGDMLERWTNGLYKSTLHRVLTVSVKERFSLAFFFEPSFDAVVECLPQCLQPGEKPNYPKTTAGKHLLDKYASTHSGYDAGLED